MLQIPAKIDAYLNNKLSGKEKTIQFQIYMKLKERPMSTDQLRNYGMPHQSITSALSQLETEGLIYKDSIVQSKDKKYTLWKCSVNEEECILNREKIHIRNYQRWVRTGKKQQFFKLYESRNQ